jgi:hypothetical protein
MRAERSDWSLSARCVRFGSVVDSQVTTTDCASDPEVAVIVTCETISVGVGVGEGLLGAVLQEWSLGFRRHSRPRTGGLK